MTDPNQLIQQAVRAIQLTEYDEAAVYLSKALVINNRHPDANHLSAVILINQGCEFDRARALVDIAIAERPDEPVFLNTLGTLHWKTTRYQEACVCLQKAIGLRPGYLDALFNLGNVFCSLNDHEAALTVYDQALEIEPENANCLNAIGYAYQCTDQNREAMRYFTQAVQQDPLRVEFYLNLANACQLCGDLDEAIIAAQNALALSPNNAMVYNNLGCFRG